LEESKRLAQKLGRKKEVTKAMTLADVYNLDEDTGLEEEIPKKAVGFGGLTR
jgi:hypothetical protein